MLMAVGMEVIGALGGASHGAYTIDVLPPDERVKSRAYMYSALNVGFTLGALVGGIALAFDSHDLLRAIPWFTAAVFIVNAAAITRLPNASHDERTPEERRTKVPGPGPLRNPGWLLTTFFIGVGWTNQFDSTPPSALPGGSNLPNDTTPAGNVTPPPSATTVPTTTQTTPTGSAVPGTVPTPVPAPEGTPVGANDSGGSWTTVLWALLVIVVVALAVVAIPLAKRARARARRRRTDPAGRQRLVLRC